MTEYNNLTFKDIEDYYRENGKLYIQFTIRVVNDEAKAVSDVATVKLDTRSYCKFYESVTPLILNNPQYKHKGNSLSYISKLMVIFHAFNV